MIKPNSYGTCRTCKNHVWLYTKKYCKDCYKVKKAKDFNKNFKPLNEYNQCLFDLYLKYITRYPIKVPKQIKNFKSVLETREINVIKLWDDIYKESKLYQEAYGKELNKGCPFKKIGIMLEEMGILEHKGNFHGLKIQKILSIFSETDLKIIKLYIEDLEKVKTSKLTIVRELEILRDTYLWLIENYECGILLIDNVKAEKYFVKISNKNYAQTTKLQIFNYLHRFFNWCKQNKHILNNPFDNIVISYPALKITVCEEEDVKRIYRYVKNPHSDREKAIMLVLTLFYGLTNRELRFLKLEKSNDRMTIIFHRHKLTKGKNYYNRVQSTQKMQLNRSETPENRPELVKRRMEL